MSSLFSYGQNSIIDSLVEHQKYSEAIQQLNILLKNIETKKGKNNKEYEKSYSFRTYLLMQAGANPNYIENSYDTLLQLKDKLFGKNSFEYSKTLSDLASVKSNNGKYRSADSLYLKCIEIRRKLLGDTSTQLVETLVNYASLKNNLHEYDKTFSILKEINRLLNDKPTELFLKVYYYKILSEAYEGINDQKNREINLLEAFSVLQDEAEAGDLDLYSSILILNGLAQFYVETENLAKAQKYYSLAIRCSKPLGRKNHYYQYAVINLARVYSQMGMKDTALSMLGDELNYPPETAYDSVAYFNLLHNMGAIYSSKKDYKKAIEIYEKVRPFYEKLPIDEKVSLLKLYKDIAVAYEEMGDINTAEYLYSKSANIFNTLSEKDKMKSYTALYDISIFYSFISKSCKSLFYLQSYIKYQNKETNNFYYFLNQQDQLKYILEKNRVNNLLLSEISKVDTCEHSVNFAYEQVFNHNNLLLYNSTSIKKHLFNNQNQSIDSLLIRLNNLNRNYYLLATGSDNEEDKNNIENDIEITKKKIITVSDYNPINYLKPDVKKILSNLKPKEAILEFVYYSYFNHKWTDSVFYGVFILKQNSPPKFIQLFERKEIQNLFTRLDKTKYKDYYNDLYLDSTLKLYNLIWKPLSFHLEGINTIYISPVGSLHNLDFNALPTDNKNVLTGEKYSIHILGSMADIIDFSSAYLNSKSIKKAIVYGGVDYDKANKSPLMKPQKIDNIGFQQISELANRSAITKFGYLPGTLVEMKNIETICKFSDINTTVNSGENASETSIKNLSGKKEPYILHLATHGYFFRDPEKTNSEDSISTNKQNIFKKSADPLFRSGLIFSGANQAWGNANYVSDSTDDGILTSYEISNLDLSNCQLVVLSACETGLGDIKGSEGVFGLQRAFKLAGVKNIIMSLWKVPDAQTSELMTSFYSYCFAGKSVHDALQAAQTEMKKKYPPYYWAGFKLLE